MQRILSRLDLATFDDPFDHPVKQSEKEGGHDSMGLPLHFIPVPGCYSPPSDGAAWTTKFFCEGRLSREIISPYYPLPPD